MKWLHQAKRKFTEVSNILKPGRTVANPPPDEEMYPSCLAPTTQACGGCHDLGLLQMVTLRVSEVGQVCALLVFWGFLQDSSGWRGSGRHNFYTLTGHHRVQTQIPLTILGFCWKRLYPAAWLCNQYEILVQKWIEMICFNRMAHHCLATFNDVKLVYV